MSPGKVAVVTGANRGLGLAICQNLVATFSAPLTLYALSRSGADLKIQPSTSFTSIMYGQVDIADPASVDALAKRVEKEKGGCDVLINNAGIFHYMIDPTPEQRNEMISVNHRGTGRMCQAFLPIMNPNGRIVNVSSANGELQHFGSQSLQARFRDPDITLQDIEQLAQEYETASAQGTAHQQGWPRKTYALTKALETTISFPLARDNPGVLINACCPGWCSTDLGNQGGTPPKTMEEGARVPLRLAFGEIGDTTGRYWANDQIWDKGEGKVRVW